MQTRAIAYPPFWRVAAGVCVAISRGSPLVLAAALVFLDTPLANPLRLIRAFAGLCLLPGLAAWALQRACAVNLGITDGLLVLEHREKRVEIPCSAIAAVEPWTIPLPGYGVWLRLRSHRRFDSGLQIAKPVSLIEALVAAGAPQEVRAAARHPALVYTETEGGMTRRWYHPWLKFVAFGLVPAVPLFRLHQWIAYGGTFGEYYTYGLQAYLLGFAVYWATLTIQLVLFAAVLRALAEVVALATAWAAPRRAAEVRRWVEIAQRVLYFGSVPVILLRLALS